jgi:hypothetical protein
VFMLDFTRALVASMPLAGMTKLTSMLKDDDCSLRFCSHEVLECCTLTSSLWHLDAY